jgi:hypothetical protein
VYEYTVNQSTERKWLSLLSVTVGQLDRNST